MDRYRSSFSLIHPDFHRAKKYIFRREAGQINSRPHRNRLAKHLGHAILRGPDRGFFREEGLEAEMVLMRASLTVQAMLAGSIDFGTATGTAVSATVNGADVRVVMAMSDTPSFDLFALPSITSVQQLRGKKIGVAGIGGVIENFPRQIFIPHQISADLV